MRTVEPLSELPGELEPPNAREARHEVRPDRETTAVRAVVQPAATDREPPVPPAETEAFHPPSPATPLAREETPALRPATPETPKRGTAAIEAVAPVRPSLERIPSRGASEGEGPVVVVNIGRIEVRAATPPAPVAPPRARRPAAVSLEEYLRPKRRDR